MSDSKKIPENTKIDRRKADLVRLWRRLHQEDDEPLDERTPPSRYIGVYRIEKRLGKGGMGKVYLAHDDRLGRRVAIKQIRRDKTRSDKDQAARHRARLRREARAVARLKHPAIAQVHDVVYDADGYSIVMEYVEGKNLAQLLAAGELDGGLAINVAIQVAQGLAAAHNLGMVHRDLKAENVMVNPAGYAQPGQTKILDFGLVKKTASDSTRESLTERGLLLGTVGSMSPEQASGRTVDARSDLFSFGVLLYEMFTGYSPFRRKRWLESLEAVKSERQPPARAVRPELPIELSNLIDWLLRKDPANRPQDTQQVVDILASIAATTRVGTLAALAPPGTSGAVPLSESAVSTGAFGPSNGSDPTSLTASGTGRAAWLNRLNPTVVSIAFLAVSTLGLVVWKIGMETSRVLVAVPELKTLEETSDYEAVSETIRWATRRTLDRLGRVRAIDPPRDVYPRDLAKLARSVGADEVLTSEIVCREGVCSVEIRRTQVSDGTIIDSRQLRQVSSADAPQEVAEAVAEQVRSLYYEP